MNRMAGLHQVPYSMGVDAPAAVTPVPQAGLAPPPAQAAPVVTMQDRAAIISALAQQGLTADAIGAELQNMGISALSAVEPKPEEVEADTGLGLTDILGQGVQQLAESTTYGAGVLAEQAGATEAGPAMRDASAAFGLTPEQQAAVAERESEQGWLGDMRDDIVRSSPQMAATMAGGLVGAKAGAAMGAAGGPAGSAIGGALGAVLGGVAVNLPAMIGSAGQRAEELGHDMNDPATQQKTVAVGAVNAVGESLINLLPGGKVGSQGFKSLAKMAAEQTVPKALGRIASVGAKGAMLEATTEAAQLMAEVVTFDPKIRAALDPDELETMAQYAYEQYGEEARRGILAGAGMGGAVGAASGVGANNRYTADLTKESMARKQATMAVKAAAEAGGLTEQSVMDAIDNPDLAPIVLQGAQSLTAAAQAVKSARMQRDAAVASGDTDMIEYANGRMKEALAQGDAAYDEVIPKLGGLTTAQRAARDAQQAQAARDRLAAEGLGNADAMANLPDSQVRSIERELTDAEKRVQAAQQVLQGPDMYETDKRLKAQADLDSANTALQRTRENVSIKTGMDTADGIRSRAQRKREEEQREAAVQRQFDRVFKPMIDRGDMQAAQTRAQLIVDESKANPDKRLDAEITKLEKQLDKASSVEQIDKLEQAIAERKARKGREAPIVAAANRFLQQATPQQTGAGVQGVSPATAGQSVAPTATGTATPEQPTMAPASVSPETQGQTAGVVQAAPAPSIPSAATPSAATPSVATPSTPSAATPSTPPAATPSTPPAATPASRAEVQANRIGTDRIRTPDGIELDVEYAVVDLDSMLASNSDDGRINPDYPQERQPRDRTGADSQQQVQRIVNEFDPRQLDKTPTTNNGAPIIDPTGVVESGNGRTMAMNRIYRERPDLAEKYKTYLATQGYPTEGINKPMLVRIRKSDMTPEQVNAYIRGSNTRDTLGMSAVEQGMADAKAMGDGTMALYRGGEIDAARNTDFVREFIRTTVVPNEQANMRDGDGLLTQDAVRRIQNAVFAKAYGDADLLGRVAQSTDSNIKNIAGALMDAAPRWAQMRVQAADGRLDPEVDKTDALMEAVKHVDRARREGTDLRALANQTDMFSGDSISPDALGFLKLMFRNADEFRTPVSREKLGGALQEYIRLAEKTSPEPDLLGQKTTPADILAAARTWLERQYGDDVVQPDLMAAPTKPEAETEAETRATQARLDAQYQKSAYVPPPMRSPVRRSPYPRYTDLTDVYRKNSATLEDARQFVLAQAQKNGFENYLAFDPETGEVLGVGTTNKPREVGMSQEVLDRLNAGRPVHFVHNHPSAGSLSPADIAIISSYPGDFTITAVGADGSVYTAQNTDLGRRKMGVTPGRPLKTSAMRRALTDAATDVRRDMAAQGIVNVGEDGGVAGYTDHMAVELAVRHAVNTALGNLGLINYNVNGVPPYTTRQQFAFDKGVEHATQTFRNAFALPGRRNSGRAAGRPGDVQRSDAVRSGRSDSEDAQGGDYGGAEFDNPSAENADDAIGRSTPDGLTELSPTQSMPVFQDAVDTLRQMLPGAKLDLEVPDWLDLDTGGGGAIAAALERAKDPGTATMQVLNFLERNLVNALAPIRNLEMQTKGELGIGMDSAFKAAEIAVNDSGRNEALMIYGGARLGPDGQYYIAEGTTGLLPMLKKLGGGQNVVDWMQYMGARRAQEIRAKGFKTPLTDADIDAGLALGEANEVFREVAADWKKFNDANVDFLVATGRIGKAQADKMKADAAYIPFYRSDERVDGVPDLYDQAGIDKASNDLIRSGGSLLARNPGIKRLKGGDTHKVNNLIQNMITNSQAMVAAGMRNYAANKTFDILTGTGDARLEPARKPGVNGDMIAAKKPEHAVSMWKNGNEYFLVPETKDAMPIMLALASMEPVRLSGLARFAAGVGSFFRQAITLNPGFMVRNMIRDVMSTAVLTGGQNLTFSSNAIQGLREGFDLRAERSTTRQMFTTLSGMGDYRFGGADIGLGRNDVLIEMGVQPKSFGYRWRQVIGQMERVGTAAELANRLAVYKGLLLKGVRADEAAYQALTLVNYGRKGGSRILRGWLPLVPFLNARIQGLARLYEDVATTKGARGKMAALSRLAVNGSLLSAFSALVWGWNNSDEDRREKYEAEPLHRRLNYHILYLPDNKTLLIPKAFEIGTIFSTVPEMMMEAGVQGDTDELGQAAVQTLTNTFAFNPIPQAALPALEVLINYDFFTGQPIEGRRMSDKLREERVNPQTAYLATAIAQSWVGGFTGMSPVMAEHLMQGYGGLAYSLPAAMVDVTAGELGLIPSRPEGVFGNMPVVTPLLKETFGSIYKDADDDTANRWVEDFYTTHQRVTQLYRTAKEAAVKGDVERARDLLARAPAAPTVYKMMNKANTRLGEVNSAMRSLRVNSKMTAEQKRAKLQILLAERNRIAGNVMGIVRQLEEEQGTSFKRAAR